MCEHCFKLLDLLSALWCAQEERRFALQSRRWGEIKFIVRHLCTIFCPRLVNLFLWHCINVKTAVVQLITTCWLSNWNEARQAMSKKCSFLSEEAFATILEQNRSIAQTTSETEWLLWWEASSSAEGQLKNVNECPNCWSHNAAHLSLYENAVTLKMKDFYKFCHIIAPLGFELLAT